MQVRRRRRKKVPLGERQPLVRPAAANDVWSMDFVFDRIADRRSIKCLAIVHDATHESVAVVPQLSMSGQQVVRALERICATAAIPESSARTTGKNFAVARALCKFGFDGELRRSPSTPVRAGIGGSMAEITTNHLCAKWTGQGSLALGRRFAGGFGRLVARLTRTGAIFFQCFSPQGDKQLFALGPFDADGRVRLRLVDAGARTAELVALYRGGTTDIHAHFAQRQRELECERAEAERARVAHAHAEAYSS